MDCFITFPDEVKNKIGSHFSIWQNTSQVQYVWASKSHGLIDLLYIATRYLAFVDTLTTIIRKSLHDHT